MADYGKAALSQIEGLSKNISDVSYTQLSGNTVIILGDSITNQNGIGDYTPSAAGDLYYYSSDGYFTWANVMLNHRLKLLANKGIGGQRTDEILARVDSDVINFSPKPAWCIVYGGTNDIGQGVPYATVISNLKSICEKLNKANIKVVLCTITPATNASTNALKQQVLQINNWIRNYCVDIPNVVICDWYKAYVDIATNQPITSATRDGVHPSPLGAAKMGQILADALKYLVPHVDTLISANANEGNLLTNGMLTGNTSGVATGATIYDVTDYTATKVARTDGLGEWQQVTFNNTVQTGKVQWQNTNVGVDWNVGDKVYADLEFQVDDGTVMKFANLVVSFYGAASGSAADLRRASADIEPSYLLKSGVMRTPIATIPANTTRLQLQFNFKGQGTFRVGRVSIRKA